MEWLPWRRCMPIRDPQPQRAAMTGLSRRSVFCFVGAGDGASAECMSCHFFPRRIRATVNTSEPYCFFFFSSPPFNGKYVTPDPPRAIKRRDPILCDATVRLPFCVCACACVSTSSIISDLVILIAHKRKVGVEERG